MPAKIKDQHLYGTPEWVREQYDERVWIGRNAVRIDPNDPGHLIVFAVAPAKKKRKKPVSEETEQVEQKPRDSRRGNGYNRTREV